MGGGCSEGSYFTAYKIHHSAITGGYKAGPNKVIFSNMILIDNMKGFSAGLSVSTDVDIDVEIQMNDNKIYGESPSPDCPSNGGFCVAESKWGMTASTILTGAKPEHPLMPSAMPYDKAKSAGSWPGKITLYRNEFHDFRSTTKDGKVLRSLYLNPYASDYIQTHTFYDTKFINVDHDSFIWLSSPDPGWANIADCGNFPCTAPLNVLFDFRRSIIMGNSSLNTGSDF